MANSESMGKGPEKIRLPEGVLLLISVHFPSLSMSVLDNNAIINGIHMFHKSNRFKYSRIYLLLTSCSTFAPIFTNLTTLNAISTAIPSGIKKNGT